MGSCCVVGDNSTSNNTAESIQQSKSAGETKTLSNKENVTTKSLGNDTKYTGRASSTKGMTKFVMQFPHIRRSFRACNKVFKSIANERDYILKAEVRPALIQLGAESSNLSSDAEIDRIIKTANLDGDEKIDFKEFLIAAAVGCFLADYVDLNKSSKEFKTNRKGFEVAKQAFDTIDVDGSGEIDYDELKTAFLAMKHDELIIERLKELDFNGDKTIEFPEFVWGITAWVGMDPDAEDDMDYDFDNNTAQNIGDAMPVEQRLSLDYDEVNDTQSK